jgi:hypothetical protein
MIRTLTTLAAFLAAASPLAPISTAAAKGGPELYPVAVEGKYGYIDARGELRIPARYDEAHSFSEGFASVRDGDAWAFIDTRGERVLGPGYEAASSFFEGLVAVRVEGKVGFLNARGKMVVEPSWDGAENFSDGLSLVREQQAYGFIDRKGRVTIPVELPWASSFSEGLAPASVGGTAAGFIDKKGQVVIEEQYSKVGAFTEGLAAVKEGGGFQYIGPDGRVAIPGEWDGAAEFSEGLATVKKGDLYGFIDRKGAVVVEPRYTAAGNLSNGRAAVEEGGKIGFIDARGKLVIPLAFDDTHGFDGALAAARQGLRWGYIDRRGEWVWRSPQTAVPEAARQAMEALTGTAIASAYYPLMVDGEIQLGPLVGAFTDERQALQAARVHAEWEVLLPHKHADKTYWGVYASDRDYLLRELTITPVEAYPSFAIVEVDSTAEELFRSAMDARVASESANRAMVQFLQESPGETANIPELRRYRRDPDGDIDSEVAKLHEIEAAASATGPG